MDVGPPLDRRWIWMCVALAAGLRLFQLGHQNLWIDEMISIQLASWATGSEFWLGLLKDIHGPFNSVVLHGWLAGGDSEFWMRLMYALVGIATIPLFYVLGRDLFGDRAGKATCLLATISPFHVWYSQEIRNYAWLVLWVCAALWLFARLWDGRGSGRTWWGLTALLAVAILTNFSAAFLLIALSVVVALKRPFPTAFAVRWAGVLVGVGLVFLPWFIDWYTRIGGERMFINAPSPVGMPLREASSFSLADVMYLFWTFSFGYSLGPPLLDLHLDRSWATFRPHVPVLLLGMLSVGGLVWFGGREVLERRRADLLLPIVVVPLALAVFLAVREIKTFHPRYLVVFFPVFIALLGAAIAHRSHVAKAAGAVFCGLLLFSLGNHYFVPRYAKADSRGAAEHILANEAPGDCVVVIYSFRPFRHYFTTAEGQADLVGVHKRFLRTDDDMRAHVARADESSERVWLVLSRWWDVAPEDKIRSIFEERLTEQGQWHFSGVKVLLYEEKDA